MTVLLVAVGAVVGAPARLLVSRALPGPKGTLVVNVLGSLLLGILVGTTSGSSYAVLGTGFCGAFTTFSTFAVEAVQERSCSYVAASITLCLLAAALGTLVQR